MKKFFLTLAMNLLGVTFLFAQVGINNDNSLPDPSAMLDVKSQTKGLLAPRVALSAINVSDPIQSPALGLLVFNTVNAGTPPNNVVVGYYFWNGNRWIQSAAPLGVSLGDLQYWNGSQWITVPAGSPGQFLQMSQANIPVWAGSSFATIITTTPYNISASGAISGGTITSDGGSAITAKGICYNTAPNPTLANLKLAAGSGTNSFSANITGLVANTTYYIRAYATNTAGTAYGNEVVFTTLPEATVPVITTTAISSIAAITATSGGTIINNGGAAVTARGVCWSTSSNPTIAGSKTVNGSGNGGFSSNLTGLTPNTLYYVRAYATNSAGTGYGNELSFTTLCSSYVTASVSITVSANPVCQGANVTFNATPTNGGTAPTYQWKVNGNNVAGATSTSYSYTPAQGDVVTCVMTSNMSCVNGNPATSNAITMTVNPQVSANVTIAASANPVCEGTAVTFTATPVNGGTNPAYQWKVNGNNVQGATTSTYQFPPVNNDAVSCTMNSNAACVTGNPATSNTLSMSVTSAQPVSVVITASENPVNAGTNVTFTAMTTNGGTNPSFQWKVNGVASGTNSSTFTYTPANEDSILCIVTSNANCTSGSPATSNIIVMVVNSNIGMPCPGIPTVTYGGQTYNTVKIGEQCWLKENLNIGSMISGIDNQTNNEVVEKYCYDNLESNCSTYGGLYQWNESLNYNPIEGTQGICPSGWHVPSDQDWCDLEIFLDSTSYCFALGWHGTDVGGKLKSTGLNHWWAPNTGATNYSGFQALPGGISVTSGVFGSLGGYANFWTSTDVSSTQSIYRYLGYYHAQIIKDLYNKNYGQSIRCIKDTCSSYTSDNVTISVSQNTICSGENVTVTALPDNGGLDPSFKWIVNGIRVGDNGPSLDFQPSEGDSIRCIMTSSVPCAANPSISNTIIMAVNPVLPVSISINASANPFMPGSTVIFTATTLNQGTSPVYQWKINGINVGNNSNSYAYTPVNGDSVWCVLTSNAQCGIGSPAISNKIMMTTSPGFPCPGIPTVTHAGKVYNTVQIGSQCWLRENMNVGTFINGAQNQTNNGTIEKYCYDNSESNCATYGGLYQWYEMMNYTNDEGGQGICPDGWHIAMNSEWDTLGAFLGGYYEAGGKMKSTGTIEEGTGLWYQPNEGATNESGFSGYPSGFWYNGFYALGEQTIYWTSTSYNNLGSNRQMVNYNSHLHANSIPGGLVKNHGFPARCIKNSCPGFSTVGVTVSSSVTSVCAGNSVTLSASIVNGGSAPQFQWKVNGTSINGATNSTFSFYPLINNSNLVSCVVTSNAQCVNGNPATSNGVTINAFSLPNPSISGPNETCINNTCIYTTDPGYTNYSWNIPGGTIISGSGSNSVSVIWNSTGNHLVMVNYSNSNGCMAATYTSKSITVYNNPQPSISGQPLPCTGNNSSIYTTESGMSNYQWSTTPGCSITSGGGVMDNFVAILWSSPGSQSVSVNYNDVNGCAALIPISYPVMVVQIPLAPIENNHNASQTQIIWNWDPVPGASGYKWNTTNDTLSAIDLGLATTKTETGLACNSLYTRYVWAFNSCGISEVLTLTQSTLPCLFACGDSLTINHMAGDVAPVTKTTVYGTVTNIPGEESKCWITSNLGSDHQATAVNDATEASAGWYWQFNRKQGFKHDGNTLTPLWTNTIINEESDWQTASDPCTLELGNIWRLPIFTEWFNVHNVGGWTNWNGPWNSGLKLHASGFLNSSGVLSDRGIFGNFWSSTKYSLEYGWHLHFNVNSSNLYGYFRAGGFSVRCLR